MGYALALDCLEPGFRVELRQRDQCPTTPDRRQDGREPGYMKKPDGDKRLLEIVFRVRRTHRVEDVKG